MTTSSHRLSGAFQHLFSINPKRQLKELFIFMSLFSFATSLITIFEPIFFWQQGYAIWQISLYYTLHYTLYIFLLPIGAKVPARFGYERSLALSAPVFVIYFLVLASIPTYPFLFWLALVILTIFKIFYWPAYHANFASYTDQHNQGTEQSWMRFIDYGSGIAGPVLGGLIAAAYGFPLLFVVAAASVALAGTTLLVTRERYQPVVLAYDAPWHLLARYEHRRMAIAMIAWAENLVYLVIWPLFLFIIVGSITAVGVIASVAATIAVAWGFIVGEITDRLSPRHTLRLFAPLVLLGYVWRIFAVTPWRAAIGDILARSATTSIGIPFIVRLYRQAIKSDPLVYSVAFEMMLAVSKAATAFILAFVFLLLPQDIAFTVAFSIAGTVALLYAVL